MPLDASEAAGLKASAVSDLSAQSRKIASVGAMDRRANGSRLLLSETAPLRMLVR